MDWKEGGLVYQEGGDVTQRNLCRLVQAEELLPSSTCCFRVAVSGTVSRGNLVHAQACRTTHIGVVVGDVTDEVQDDTVGIMVEDRTDHSHMPLGNWALCEITKEDAYPIPRVKGRPGCNGGVLLVL